MTFAVVLAVVLILFLSIDDSDAARGRGGSRSSSGSKSKSSKSSKSRNKSSSGGSKSASKPKITKYTPIKTTTVRSPVIVKQTKDGSRSDMFTNAVVGYLALRYTLGAAPVYRRGCPMYGSYLSIPEKRAVRVTHEEKKLLDDGGGLCVGKSNVTRTPRKGIDEQLAELNTTVKYKNGKMQTYYGINKTFSLEDIKEEDFEVTSRARYNTAIVSGTNCTQVETKIQGTMIAMYETNPNAASPLYISSVLVLFAVIPMFLY